MKYLTKIFIKRSTFNFYSHQHTFNITQYLKKLFYKHVNIFFVKHIMERVERKRNVVVKTVWKTSLQNFPTPSNFQSQIIFKQLLNFKLRDGEKELKKKLTQTVGSKHNFFSFSFFVLLGEKNPQVLSRARNSFQVMRGRKHTKSWR